MKKDRSRADVFVWSPTTVEIHSPSKKCDVKRTHWKKWNGAFWEEKVTTDHEVDKDGNLSLPLEYGPNRLEFKNASETSDTLLDLDVGALAMKGDPDPWPPPPPSSAVTAWLANKPTET